VSADKLENFRAPLGSDQASFEEGKVRVVCRSKRAALKWAAALNEVASVTRITRISDFQKRNVVGGVSHSYRIYAEF
jgi:hypothetical protein